MQIKYFVCCYVEHWGYNRILRKEVEFPDEPSNNMVEYILSSIGLDAYIDYEIDYSTGAILPDDDMPRKSKVKCMYAVVEKRFYGEVLA